MFQQKSNHKVELYFGSVRGNFTRLFAKPTWLDQKTNIMLGLATHTKCNVNSIVFLGSRFSENLFLGAEGGQIISANN